MTLALLRLTLARHRSVPISHLSHLGPTPALQTLRPYTTGKPARKMGKKKPSVPAEEHLLLPQHPARPDAQTTPIVDTHTHLLSTFSFYRSKYKEGKHDTVYDFVRELYRGHGVDAIVDVYCEAPVTKQWRELADSALSEEDRRVKWGGLEYWFVMGQSSSRHRPSNARTLMFGFHRRPSVSFGESEASVRLHHSAQT